MPAGLHDKLASIQTRGGSEDAGGNVVSSWTAAATRWARIEDQSGIELYRARQVDPIVSAIITLREKYSGLGPDDRIVVGGRTFSVVAVLGASDRETRRGQIISVTEEL